MPALVVRHTDPAIMISRTHEPVEAAARPLAIYALWTKRAAGGGGGISSGAIAGIIIAVLLVPVLILIFVHYRRRSSSPAHPYPPALTTSKPFAFPLVQPQSPTYLPRYTPTQPYPHMAHSHSPPAVVYPIRPQSTYYAPTHHQPQGVRFGEVGVRRI